jgi:hypothetical protein
MEQTEKEIIVEQTEKKITVTKNGQYLGTLLG